MKHSTIWGNTVKAFRYLYQYAMCIIGGMFGMLVVCLLLLAVAQVAYWFGLRFD